MASFSAFFPILFLHVESKEDGEQRDIKPLYVLTQLRACALQQAPHRPGWQRATAHSLFQATNTNP